MPWSPGGQPGQRLMKVVQRRNEVHVPASTKTPVTPFTIAKRTSCSAPNRHGAGLASLAHRRAARPGPDGECHRFAEADAGDGQGGHEGGVALRPGMPSQNIGGGAASSLASRRGRG